MIGRPGVSGLLMHLCNPEDGRPRPSLQRQHFTLYTSSSLTRRPRWKHSTLGSREKTNRFRAGIRSPPSTPPPNAPASSAVRPRPPSPEATAAAAAENSAAARGSSGLSARSASSRARTAARSALFHVFGWVDGWVGVGMWFLLRGYWKRGTPHPDPYPSTTPHHTPHASHQSSIHTHT